MMLEHSRYEELCALAGAGQISAEELTELQGHLQDCGFCRALQSDFIGINSLYLAQAEKLEPELYDPQSALRNKILRNLQSAGAEFSGEVKQEIADRPDRLRRFWVLPSISSGPVWAAAAVVVVGFLGFEVGTYTHPLSQNNKVVAVAEKPPGPMQANAPVAPVVNDDSKLIAAQQTQATLQGKLVSAEFERTQLEAQLKQAKQEIAALQDARNRDQTAIAQIQAAAQQDRTASQAAQAQLRTLREAQNSRDADLVAAQYKIGELQTKLADQNDAIARERQVLTSGNEVADLIGARNLHIIDVADVGPHGQKRPFGRVFYTEGKSLIFYAYDLSGSKGKQTFYAWGHKEGDPHSTKALGALKNDDEAQKRWVFRFDNTKVLSQIDSVYVTLEPSDKPGEKPRGQKLMNAYLGTPANHP
jgi:hypothetical protein